MVGWQKKINFEIMKKVQFFAISLMCLTTVAQTYHVNNSLTSTESNRPVELPKLTNNAFKKGESLEYRIHYGVVDAGVVKAEILKEDRKIGGHDVYHIVGTGTSNRFFDFFFKIRDKYESYIDA